jgi:chromate reductase, NAD(P)H dehydrogenase (quinone)
VITVIAGTNRPGSNSAIVANEYLSLLKQEGIDSQLLSLEYLPADFAYADMYGHRREDMNRIIERYISPVNLFVFVIPEYNGGFPGVLKSFIDVVPPAEFHHKKAGLIGISSGHSGSLRAMDQFTNVLNYLKVNVYHFKPKFSKIEEMLDAEGKFISPEPLELLRTHIAGLRDM